MPSFRQVWHFITAVSTIHWLYTVGGSSVLTAAVGGTIYWLDLLPILLFALLVFGVFLLFLAILLTRARPLVEWAVARTGPTTVDPTPARADEQTRWLDGIVSRNLEHFEKYIEQGAPKGRFELSGPSPYAEFTFSLVNRTILEMTVDPHLRGNIRFNGYEAAPSPVIDLSNTGTGILVIQPQSNWRLVLRQPLGDSMARYVAEQMEKVWTRIDRDTERIAKGEQPSGSMEAVIPVDFTAVEINLTVRKGRPGERLRLPMGHFAVAIGGRPPL